MKTVFLCMLAVICGLLSVSARAELLVNPGFELNTNPLPPAVWQEGWMPSNWFKWGAGGWASYKSASRQALQYSPHSGDKFYAVGAWTSGDHFNIGQVVPAYPGEVFTISAWAQTENWSNPDATPYGYFLVQWFDASGVQIIPDAFGPLMQGLEVLTWTQYSYTTVAAPAGTVTANFQIEGDSQGTVMVDDVSLKLRYAANDPVPDINSLATTSTTQLNWTMPAPRTAGPVTVDVWFGTTIAGMTKVVNNQAVNSWTITPPLTLGQYYYWRVDCRDNGILTTGRQWQFRTANQAPVVNAGAKQNIWLASGTASAVMNAVVTDDNMPNPPKTVTYLWSVDSGPGSVTFAPSATVLNPTAAFTAAGDYILRLTANDSDLSGYNTVKVRVFAAGDTGLIAEYRFNETSGTTAADSVGGHTGALVGSPTWLPTGGKIGGALQLSGVGQYVNIGGGGVFDHNTAPTWVDLKNEVTVSAWIKLPVAGWPGGNLPWTAIVTKGDTSWRLTRNAISDTVYFYCNGLQAFGQEVIGLTSVADNKWHFIAGTYDGATIAMYIDGILQHSYPSSGQITLNIYDACIGYNAQTNSRAFAGIIDEVRIHNVGLPQSMIRAQYTADGGAVICPTFLAGDVNQDCYVNFKDVAALATNWLKCNDITQPGRCQ